MATKDDRKLKDGQKKAAPAVKSGTVRGEEISTRVGILTAWQGPAIPAIALRARLRTEKKWLTKMGVLSPDRTRGERFVDEEAFAVFCRERALNVSAFKLQIAFPVGDAAVLDAINAMSAVGDPERNRSVAMEIAAGLLDSLGYPLVAEHLNTYV